MHFSKQLKQAACHAVAEKCLNEFPVFFPSCHLLFVRDAAWMEVFAAAGLSGRQHLPSRAAKEAGLDLNGRCIAVAASGSAPVRQDCAWSLPGLRVGPEHNGDADSGVGFPTVWIERWIGHGLAPLSGRAIASKRAVAPSTVIKGPWQMKC